MSGYGRGGGGGGGGGSSSNIGGKMHGQKLPFDVDPTLEAEMAKYAADESRDGRNERQERVAFLFPPFPGGVPNAPPVTAVEKARVQTYRELQAAFHASVFYTGPKGSLAATKRSAADYDAFNDQLTYGKRFEQPDFELPDLKKHKFADLDLFPKELRNELGITEDDDGGNQSGRVLGLSTAAVLDKLAKFDDSDPEEEGAADHGLVTYEGEDENAAENGSVVSEHEGEDDVVAGKVADDPEASDDDKVADEDEDKGEEQRDDEFEEDDEDDVDDYNAQLYYEEGDDDIEAAGDDDYGAGDDGY